MMRIYLILICFVGIGPLASADASPKQASILLFDPDANYQAIASSIGWFNRYFEEELPGYVLTGTPDWTSFVRSAQQLSVRYAVVSATALDAERPFDLRPLAVPQAQGSVYYRKLLVDRGEGEAGDLSGKRIAAALGGETEVDRQRTLRTLAAAGVGVEGALLWPVSKDVDALFAVVFSQADAALTRPVSLEVLRNINPSAAAGLRTIWKSAGILRSPLCAVGSAKAGNDDGKLLKAFLRMHESEAGRNAMQTQGFSRWVPYRASMRRAQ